jgi:hypothetical protein
VNTLIFSRMKRIRAAGLVTLFVIAFIPVAARAQCAKNHFINFQPSASHSFTKESNETPVEWSKSWFTSRKKDDCRDLFKASDESPLQQSQAPPVDDTHELAKKLSNPVSSLISFPLQSNFDFGMGSGSGWRYTLNLQPVIPFSLSPKWNMISRTIIPIIHQHNVVPGSTQTGLGDIAQSLFFSPTDSKKFIWGVGPQLLIPTATDDNLGTEKFGLGPTFLILKQEHGWTYGMLSNHVWSVAGDDSRADVNSTFLQPFLAYNTKDAWTYNVNTEASYDWTGNHWSIPIHVTVTKLVKFGKQPVSFGGAMRCWVTSPRGGPQHCGFRIIVTPLFPR